MERKQIKNKQFEIFKNTYFYKTPLVPAAVLKVTFSLSNKSQVRPTIVIILIWNILPKFD